MSAIGVPEPIFCLRGHSEPVSSLEFFNNSSQSANLITGSSNGSLKIWDLDTFRCVCNQNSDEDSGLLGISQSVANSDVFYTYERSNGICSRNINEIKNPYQVVKTISQGFCMCELFYIRGCENIAYAGEKNSSVCIFDTKSESISQKLIPNKGTQLGTVMCLKTLPTECFYLTVGYENGTILLWDLRFNKIISSYKAHSDPIMCLDVNQRDGTFRGLSGSADQIVKSWKINSDQTITHHKDIQIPTNGVSCLKIRPDNKIVCLSCWDGTVRIYSCKSLKLLAVLDYHSENVHCIKFCNLKIGKLRNLIGIGSKDKQVSLWSLYS